MAKQQYGNPTGSFANIGLPSADDNEKALDATMRALARDRYNVHARGDMVKTEQAKLAPLPVDRSGWRESAPLDVPGGARTQELIARVAEHLNPSLGTQRLKAVHEMMKAREAQTENEAEVVVGLRKKPLR